MRRVLPPFLAVRAFEAAARHLSFKQAAEELFVTQSAVSHQVKALEEFLERQLFLRKANGVMLTPAGKQYFDDVAAILDQLDESTRRNTYCKTAIRLHVRSTPAFAARWLLKKITSFNMAYPEIELQVTTGIETANFRTDDVDILIQYGQQHAGGLSVVPFLSTSRVPVCSPEFADSRPSIQTPEDLLQHTLLRDVVGDEWTDWFKSAGVENPDSVHGPLFEHCDLSLRAAEQGQGIALAYEALISDEISEGILVKLFEIETMPQVIYSLTCPKNWIDRPKISVFRRWLLKEMGQISGSLNIPARPIDNRKYVPAYPYPN
jgi:LysR family transcriptional regulator, glycine cleavage system transcriptional activator